VRAHATSPRGLTVLGWSEAGGCGSMYNIEIESAQFKGLRTPKQHQMVTAVIEVSRPTAPQSPHVFVNGDPENRS
jgi:stress-induced morphogen